MTARSLAAFSLLVASLAGCGGPETDRVSGIYIVQADGSHARVAGVERGEDNLVPRVLDEAHRCRVHATRSPGGLRIVVSRGNTLYTRHVGRVDGTPRRRLTRAPIGYEDIRPAWIDDSTIAFWRELQPALP